MDTSQRFCELLNSSAADFIWAIGQVQQGRIFKPPPEGLGDWSAGRHVFHMVYYERKVAVPNMKLWVCEGSLPQEEYAEQAEWNPDRDLNDLQDGFRTVRREQADLLSQVHEEQWQELRETNWGPKPLMWVMTKTYQHTAEHTSDILQLALFWDDVEQYHLKIK
jgi:hypothetical protein